MTFGATNLWRKFKNSACAWSRWISSLFVKNLTLTGFISSPFIFLYFLQLSAFNTRPMDLKLSPNYVSEMIYYMRKSAADFPFQLLASAVAAVPLHSPLITVSGESYDSADDARLYSYFNNFRRATTLCISVKCQQNLFN